MSENSGVQSLNNNDTDSQTPSKTRKKTQSKKPLKKVIVCVDVGSSLNKILYQVEGHDVRYMVMEPEHLTLPPSSVASLPSDSGMGRPSDNAWIRFKKGEECHAVGRCAHDFKAFVNFKTLKWQIATPKILGALGAIAEREKLGSSFSLDLGVLLPWGEISSTEQLESELKSSLRGFYFRSTRLKVKLERYKCVPEGSGIALWTGMNQSSDLAQNNIAFLMFGHRNTSGLFFRRGSLSRAESSTTTLGFYDLIDKMREKVAGLERKDLLRAMKTTNKMIRGSRGYFERPFTDINWDVITKSDLEVEKLQTAYETSLSEYWALVSNWLNSTLPNAIEIDGIFCCGGASGLLLDNVCQYFSGINVYRPLLCGDELKSVLNLENGYGYKEINDYSNKKFLELNLVSRFTDVWGFFSVFSGYKVEQQEVA